MSGPSVHETPVFARLLPDVQSRPSRAGSTQSGWIGESPQAHPRPLRLLLERSAPFQSTPLAGTLLLLPTRSSALVANLALHGVEPCTRRTGERRSILAMVERRGALGSDGGLRITRPRTLVRPLVCFQLACLPRSRRNPVRVGRNSSLHLHRPSPGH